MKNSVLIMGLLTIVAFCATHDDATQQDFASQYTGFDVNVGVGCSATQVILKSTDPIEGSTNEFDTYDVYQGGSGIAVQGRVGYTLGFCDCWIVGLDGYAQYNGYSLKTNMNLILLDFAGHGKVEALTNYGIDFRFGVATCNSLFYLTVGPDWVYDKEDHVATSGGVTLTTRHRQYKLGVRAGAGAEQHLLSNLVIKEQFSYSWFNDFDYTTNDFSNRKYDIHMPTTLFMLSYLF